MVYIYIYDSLGGESLLNAYPNIYADVNNIKKRSEITNNYNNKRSSNTVRFKNKISKNLCSYIDNKGGSDEERYFNEILKAIFKSRKKSKIYIASILNRIQPNYTGTCGLYCLFYIDIGILNLYRKDNKFIRDNFSSILKDHTHFVAKIFESQSFIKGIRSQKIRESNELNIEHIYSRYIE